MKGDYLLWKYYTLQTTRRWRSCPFVSRSDFIKKLCVYRKVRFSFCKTKGLTLHLRSHYNCLRSLIQIKHATMYIQVFGGGRTWMTFGDIWVWSSVGPLLAAFPSSVCTMLLNLRKTPLRAGPSNKKRKLFFYFFFPNLRESESQRGHRGRGRSILLVEQSTRCGAWSQRS